MPHALVSELSEPPFLQRATSSVHQLENSLYSPFIKAHFDSPPSPKQSLSHLLNSGSS